AQHAFHNGAIGSALALLITELLVALGALVAVHHALVRPLVRRVLLAFAASGVAWAVAFLVRSVGIVEGMLAGLATLVILTAWWRIPTAEEIAFARRVV